MPKNEPARSNASSKAKLQTANEAYEEALKRGSPRHTKYIFRLYVSGSSTRSLRAIANLKKLCDEYLPGNYELEVIDIYKNPHIAREAQIIAAPTLVKQLPQPLRRFVGDLSNTRKLLIGLNINEGSEDRGSH